MQKIQIRLIIKQSAKLNINCYKAMQIQNVVELLNQTLNPSHVHQAQNALLAQSQTSGFITSLLIISANPDHNIATRQAALIHIKNALLDDYKNNVHLPDNDFDTLKASIHQALIQNCQEKSITPTFREIVCILAEYEYPHNWPEIIPQIANNLQNSGDFNQLFGSIETLKAIVSAVVQKVDHRMTLENLSNKIVLPLLSLASKLFQNYNQTTSFILISIFKIFSAITNFHIPEIIIANIHSWMIFIKKLLDLNIESGNIDMNMYHLKKICLRIMFRFYQRHLNKKFSDAPKHVIEDFHNKFTKGITESLLLQIINEAHMSKNSTNKNYIKLTKYSLSCLSYVYEEDRNAALIIDRYKEKIIYLCLERYKTKVSKSYSSYGEFASKLNEQRAHLCQFIKGLIKNETKVAEQRAKNNYNYNNLSEGMAILGSLYAHIESGDMDLKQLCLYIYSDIASVLPQSENQIQQKMLAFILKIVSPLLNSSESPKILKLRCCEILSKFSYIQIPQNELTNIAAGVYGCLVSNLSNPDNTSMETYLQIHSVHAFNSLLRYDFIINYIASYLNSILQVYTSLLEIEVSIIKCLEDMLSKFETHIQPYGNNLIEMLANMFFKYNELAFKAKSGQLKNNHSIQNQNEDDESDDEGGESTDNNYVNSSKACLGAIRQIIQAPDFIFQKDDMIHNLLISIFSDPDLLYVEEGFNILNQIIFKSKNLKQDYNIYFSVIIYGILPLNEAYIKSLKSQNSNLSNVLLKMLECQCADPDDGYIENTIGCLRNFISKYKGNLRNVKEKSGLSLLDLLLNAVKHIHQNQGHKQNLTQSDRAIILTIYISLIEWQAVNEQELKNILQNVGTWLNMQRQILKNNMLNDGKNNQIQIKTTYGPIYLQIILLSIHFYPKVTLGIMNGDWIATEIIQNWERFHVDYEICRLLIAIADLLNFQSVKDLAVSAQLMRRLPDLIETQCKIRVGEQQNQIESDDDQAIEDEEKYFGMDENTHIMGWIKPINNQLNQRNNQANEPKQEMDEEEYEEEDEEDEFNKYYESPLDSIDEVKYIGEILRGQICDWYMGLMSNEGQQKLSYLILNAPSKFNDLNHH